MLSEVIDKMKEDFRQEGLQMGIETGLQKGLQEGRQEGLQKGLQEARRSNAMRMLRKGYPLEEVMEITELPREEINALANQVATEQRS